MKKFFPVNVLLALLVPALALAAGNILTWQINGQTYPAELKVPAARGAPGPARHCAFPGNGPSGNETRFTVK